VGFAGRRRQVSERPRAACFGGSRVVALTALAYGVSLAGCADTTITPRPELGRTRAARPSVTSPVQPAMPVAQPAVRTVTLGHSVKGVPLVLEVFGDGPDRVLIFGGIHGNEPTSVTLAQSLANHLRVNWDLFAGRTVAILAKANPDGLAARRRTNASGVDLNRNFPARNWRRAKGAGTRHGARPASEPETQAIMRAIELVRPARILSIHSTRRGTHCNNYDGPARDVAQQMARSNGYPVRDTMGYPTPGSFGSWAGIDRGIPTITLELPRDRNATQCWRENAAAVLGFVDAGSVTAGR
jgi:protein MpaA